MTNSLGEWMMFAKLTYCPCAVWSSRVMRIVGCCCGCCSAIGLRTRRTSSYSRTPGRPAGNESSSAPDSSGAPRAHGLDRLLEPDDLEERRLGGIEGVGPAHHELIEVEQ